MWREHDYFSSRDFTINEILSNGEEIYLTKNCLLDTIRGIIKVTEFEYKESFSDREKVFINPKLLSKALRFLVSLRQNIDKEYIFENEENIKYQGIGDFHLALHLDRALEQGLDKAEVYI